MWGWLWKERFSLRAESAAVALLPNEILGAFCQSCRGFPCVLASPRGISQLLALEDASWAALEDHGCGQASCPVPVPSGPLCPPPPVAALPGVELGHQGFGTTNALLTLCLFLCQSFAVSVFHNALRKWARGMETPLEASLAFFTSPLSGFPREG